MTGKTDPAHAHNPLVADNVTEAEQNHPEGYRYCGTCLTALPDFPRPDLPESHPENYPVLKIRVLRRLGLPDDGGLWLSDAIDSGVLRSYAGFVTEDTADYLLIQFASLGSAVSWAEAITMTGTDRTMISLATAPASPYSPAVVKVRLH